MPNLSKSPKTTIEAFAPAKINLALHVVGQRADGYHLIDSLVTFATVGDRLWLEPHPTKAMEVVGPFAKGVPTDKRNLAWRAAELAGWSGHIRIEKNLPHGAGIGGGSSDAAAVLRALNSEDTGLSLGADIPVCRYGKTARMSGIGEVIEPAPLVPDCMHALIVNPMISVPTASVFKALTQKSNTGLSAICEDPDLFLDWLSKQRNDLEKPATAQAPEIVDVLQALRIYGAQLARMSGSGATCFAVFEEAAAAAQAAIKLQKAHPDWWVQTCQFGNAQGL